MDVRISEREWIDPHRAFWSVRDAPGVAFLESAMRGHTDSRWSYLALDPVVEIIVLPDACRIRRRGQSAWSVCGEWETAVRDELTRCHGEAPHGGPPFTGGWIGWFGYELASRFDRIPVSSERVMGAPLASLAFYDAVDCYDQAERRRWRAEISSEASQALELAVRDVIPVVPPAPDAVASSNFTPAAYRDAVRAAIEYIFAGDIYQVNLSRQFRIQGDVTAPDAYFRLRERSPAPYSAFLRGPEGALISSSPELFLDLDPSDRALVSRPIKGTRPRGKDYDEEVRLALELSRSEKDCAENLMIVDLVRNDLGRVCEIGSVHVPEMFRRELHPVVMHLVSTVRGRLREGLDAVDALHALFPGGSVTGAPKIRACEIIQELEPNARGPYTGTYGFISVTGRAKLAMSIRVIWVSPEGAAFSAGGGIVADSDCEEEFRETVTKAAALHAAMGQQEGTR